MNNVKYKSYVSYAFDSPGGASPISRLPAQPANRQQSSDHTATLLLRVTMRLTGLMATPGEFHRTTPVSAAVHVIITGVMSAKK